MRAFAWLIALALLSCGCGDEASGGTSAADSSSKAGSELYKSQGCGVCHGPDGAGTVFGPTLHGKRSFWSAEKLVAYLRDPSGYSAKDPRLSEQAKKFSLPMQRFDKLTEAELGQLAAHVLAMP